MTISSQGASPSVRSRPILFSGPMIRALLDGRKMQTRRIVKPQPQGQLLGLLQRPIRSMKDDPTLRAWFEAGETENASQEVTCPYGEPGDLLWVRETWGTPEADHPRCLDGRKPQPSDRLVFRANPADAYQWGVGKPSQGGFCWRPSIHMPRWASRLTLEITGVRVERLQDISSGGTEAEGIERRRIVDKWGVERDAWALPEQWADTDGGKWKPCEVSFAVANHAYGNLWNRVNGPDSWEVNPWVWVLEFRVHRCNVDELLRQMAA